MQLKKKEEILKEKKKRVNDLFCKLEIQYDRQHCYRTLEKTQKVILTYMHAGCHLSKKTNRKKKLRRKMLLHHTRPGKKRKRRVSKEKPKKSKT